MFKNIVLVVPNPMTPSTKKGFVEQQQQKNSLVKQRKNKALKNKLRTKKGLIPVELKNDKVFFLSLLRAKMVLCQVKVEC